MPRSSIAAAALVLAACGPTVGTVDENGGSGGGSTGGGAADDGTPDDGGDPADDDAADVAESGAVDDLPVDPVPPVPRPDCDARDTLQDAWVHIDGGDLDERDSLQGVRVIDGSLRITRAPDADLSFLECIREITGDLVIHDSDALADVSGLYYLEFLGGNLVVADNDVLTDFNGLQGVQSIESPPPRRSSYESSVVVIDNPSLQRITGLSSLAAIHGSLLITDNPALVDIGGLANLQAVGDQLAINHNASLCISHVDAIGAGIVEPSPPPDEWTTVGNDEGC